MPAIDSCHKMVLPNLETVVRQEVAKYAAYSFTSKLCTLTDETQHLYAVVSVPNPTRAWPSKVIVMAQVIEDKVVIIEDVTDKPLVDALMVNAGIQRNKIVLTYRGETISGA